MTAARLVADEALADTPTAARRYAATSLTAAKPTRLAAPVRYDTRHQSLDLLIEHIAEILNSEVALY